MDKNPTSPTFRDVFIERATAFWMERAGLPIDDPNTSPYELDLDREDSQIRAWYDTASEAFDIFIGVVDELDGAGSVEQPQPEPELNRKAESNVTKTSSIFIFMNPKPGTARYVRDVREWLQAVDELGDFDDEEIEGELFFNVDQSLVSAETSECLECGDKNDYLLSTHTCSTK